MLTSGRDLRSSVFRFLVGPNQAIRLVHVSLIAKQSSALHHLVHKPMKEANNQEAVWDDIDEGTFERFSQFIYTGDYDSPSHYKETPYLVEGEEEGHWAEPATDLLAICAAGQNTTATNEPAPILKVEVRNPAENHLTMHHPSVAILEDLQVNENGEVRGLNGTILAKAVPVDGASITHSTVNENGEALDYHSEVVGHIEFLVQPKGFAIRSSQLGTLLLRDPRPAFTSLSYEIR